MNDSRKKMLEKVKAILAKTMDNGCTEGEAMAALAKARELMAMYEIDEKELQDVTEKAQVHKTAPSDPYEIKRNLCVNVGKFTSCKAFRDREKVINFAGKPGDIMFATWLLDTLQRYVMRSLRAYQADRDKKRLGNSNHTSVSFVVGCAHTINEKLKELVPINWAKTQELIVAELGMSLTKFRGRGKEIDQNAARMGQRAGDSARFDRPVEQSGQLRLK
jgi:hypothetical protein